MKWDKTNPGAWASNPTRFKILFVGPKRYWVGDGTTESIHPSLELAKQACENRVRWENES
jgi:hypothetical protein